METGEARWSPGPVGESVDQVALELARRGFDTVAAMRNPDDGAGPGRPPASGRISVVRMDVTDPDSYRLPDDLRVLVNNAGVDSDYLPVEHGEPGRLATAVRDQRVRAGRPSPKRPYRSCGPTGPAVVCNISSSSILASVPFYSAYRATKAAVSAFGESLRVEVAPFGHPGGRDPPRSHRHRHVPAQHRGAGRHPVRALPVDGRSGGRACVGKLPTRWCRPPRTPPAHRGCHSRRCRARCATAAIRSRSDCSMSGATPTTRACSP